MKHVNNAKIVKVLKILKNMTINDDDTIIDNNSNFFINGLDNKSFKNEKKLKVVI